MKKLSALLLLALFASVGHTQQLINCATNTACSGGGPSNTGTGDALPIAGTKINANFLALPTQLFNGQPLPIATGGTGATSLAAASIPVQSGSITAGDCVKWLSSTTIADFGAGCGGTIFQANGTGLSSSTTINFENSVATGGLILTFTNPSAGNVQLGLSGWPGTLINGDCLTNNGTTISWGGCGGSTAFSALTSGTNTTAAMLVGTGASLGPTGTGTISANQVNGAVVPTSAAVLASNGSNQLTAAATTGSGSVVLATSPVLTTPNLGTPSILTLTNASGLPLSGVTGLGTGVATFLATPTSGNLAAALTDETGTGSAVFGTSPTLTTPNLGTPSAITLTNATFPASISAITTLSGLTSANGSTVPATAGTLAGSTGAFTTGHCLQVGSTTPLEIQDNGSACGTGGSTAFSALTGGTNTTAAMVVGTGASLAVSGSGTITATAAPVAGITGLGAGVGAWLATPTSANLASALTDETGTGAAVFATSPTLVTPTLGAATATSINGNTFTAGTYTLTGTAAKTLNFTNSLTLSGTDATTMTFPATTGTVDTLNATQTFTAPKTFTNSDLLLLGSSTGATTFTSANAGASAFTATIPANTGTVAELNLSQTWTGTQTFNGTLAGTAFATPPAIGGTTPAAGAFTTLSASSTLTTNVTGSTQCLHVNTSGVVSGTGSDCGSGGSTAFSALTGSTNTTAAMVVGTGASLAASGSGTITATAAPVAGISGLGTGVGTWLATPSSSNLASAVTGATGTGALVFGTSPTFTTPALGTPSALVLTNATGTPSSIGLANGTGLPLTGLATQASNTIDCNATGGSASPTACSAATTIGVLNSTAANAQTGTSYTPVLGDANLFITMSNASANTFCIPPNSSVAYAVGTTLTVEELGAGITTVAPAGASGCTGTGVTVTSVQYGSSTSQTYALAGIYDLFQIRQISTNNWLVTGVGPGRMLQSGVVNLASNAFGGVVNALPFANGGTGTIGVNSVSTATSVTPNCTYGLVKITASATGTFTLNAPGTCTPVDGQKLTLKVTSPSGGTITYSWNAAYLASATLALPTTSNAASKEDYFGFQYDSDKSGWVYLASNQGF
jgi:hypothetical protein